MQSIIMSFSISANQASSRVNYRTKIKIGIILNLFKFKNARIIFYLHVTNETLISINLMTLLPIK